MKNQNKTKYQPLHTLFFLFFVCSTLIFDRIAQAAPDTTPPTVITTNPIDGATDVGIDSTITATFSEKMDTSTVTTGTFMVNDGVSDIGGTVSYNHGQKKATFTPSGNLSYSTTYTAKITTGVKDEAGNAMTSDYQWSFTTASASDTPPTIVSTSPANGETDVTINSAITATFSEKMDASTITTETFMVNDGASNIGGAVSYNHGQKKATFTPSGNLSYSTTYTAEITTGVKDEAGNAMASDYQWSFTTASGPDTTPPAVNSTSPINEATGVAVSTIITARFSEKMDASTINTDSFTVGSGGGNVSGIVSFNSGQKTATFTPSGNLSNSTTYSAMITTAVKDVAGNAMSSVYTWSFTTVSAPVSVQPPSVEKFMIISTSPLSDDTDVRIDTTVSATFSMYINGYTFTTSTFKLNDGDNEVYGSVTTNGATATFTPAENLAYNTKYSATITTGAQAANWGGTTLDCNYTWSFMTIMDTEPPTVISISPDNGATDVSLDSVISVTFSEELDATTITTDTFEVSVGSNKIDGTISYNGTTATLTPSNNLLSSTTYTVEITTDVKDLAGNSLASHYYSSFTTISEPDTTPPTVVSTSPANGTTDVSIESIISVTFSEELDASTINTDTFRLLNGSSQISGTLSYSDMTVTFTPSSNLSYSTTYTIDIEAAVTDLAGNPMETEYNSSFTTTSEPDTTPPAIISTNPINGATDLATNITISATFSEAMDETTITTDTFAVSDGKRNISGTVSYNNTIATFTPSEGLDFNTIYTATVTTGARDLSGNSLASANTWSFATRLMPIVTPTLIPTSTPASTPTATPSLCNAKTMTAFPKRLKIKRKESGYVKITLTGEGDCPVEGETIKAKIIKGKKLITVSPASAITNEDGQTEFTITALKKIGKAEVQFKAKQVKTKIQVKVTK